MGVNEATKVSFAIVTGNSLSQLETSVTKAQTRYQEYLDTPPLIQVAESCPGLSATLDPIAGTNYNFYDDIALTNLVFTGSAYVTPPVTTPQTYYVVNLDSTFDGDVQRVIARAKGVNTDFEFSANPLLLDETGNTKEIFTDISVDAVSWNWDFNNGFTATLQHPEMNFFEKGSYTIELTAENDLGCVEFTSKVLEVDYKSNLPDIISSTTICRYDSVTLSATNATNLKVFSDLDLTDELFSGTAFNTGSLSKDTTFYIVSTDSTYRSNPKTVSIDISDVEAGFSYAPDTLDLNNKTLLTFNNESTDFQIFYWYINNELAAVGEDINYDYNGLNINVSLIAEDLNGCRDTLNQLITPSASPLPVLPDLETCTHTNVSINPNGGTYFHFYSDPNLSNLIGKGSRLSIPDLDRDTTIYITNVDNLTESDVLDFNIDVKDLNVDFSTSPEQLNLLEGNTATFTNMSDATSWLWVMEEDTISQDESTMITFDDVGVYQIKLMMSNTDLNCHKSVTKNYTVSRITGLEDFLEIGKIYPNPTEGLINIPTGYGQAILSLWSKNGKFVQHLPSGSPSVSIKHLIDGLYFLKIQDHNTVQWIKLIKENP